MIVVPVQQTIQPATVAQLPLLSIRTQNQQLPIIPQTVQSAQSSANREAGAEKSSNTGYAATSSTSSAAAGAENPRVNERQTTQQEHDAQQQQRSDAESSRKSAERAKQQQEHIIIQSLAARDRDVKAHEGAHAAVGGQYAGTPQLQFIKGPNGVLYAVSGEVSISTSEIQGDPRRSLAKLEQVMRAALAPANPSSQDLQVASRAAGAIARLRGQIASEAGNIKPTLTSQEAFPGNRLRQSLEARIRQTGATTSAVPSVLRASA